MTTTPEEIHDTFIFALSRHSLAARLEREERELQAAWEEELERELERERWREEEEEYDRRREAEPQPEYDYERYDSACQEYRELRQPWYEDPDFIGWEADEPEELLPCEVRLNSRLRAQEGRQADWLRHLLDYGWHSGASRKCHRRGYDPDRRRQWRREQRKS